MDQADAEPQQPAPEHTSRATGAEPEPERPDQQRAGDIRDASENEDVNREEFSPQVDEDDNLHPEVEGDDDAEDVEAEDDEPEMSRPLQESRTIIVELRLVTSALLRPALSVDAWRKAISERAARDWVGELGSLLRKIEATAKGDEGRLQLERASELLLASTERMVNFIPRRHPAVEWDWETAGWQTTDADLSDARQSDFGRVDALRAEIRGRFEYVVSLAAFVPEEEATGRMDTTRKKAGLSPVDVEALKALEKIGSGKPAAVKQHCAGGEYAVVRERLRRLLDKKLVGQPGGKNTPYVMIDSGRQALSEHRDRAKRSKL